MKKLRFLFLAVALFLFLFSIIACGPLGGGGEWNVVWITEDVTTPTTWTSGNVYVIDTYDFYVTSTLTIQPGTIVKFHPTEGPYLVLGGSGTLVADGTSSSPIVFTSFKDDAHGGDTNEDGSATSPARNDWMHVDTNGLNGSLFDWCEFYYGGGGTYDSTLMVSSGSDNVTVTHCTFAHNDGGDFSGWESALDAHGGGAGVVIEDNVFFDNVRPLSISCLFDLNDSNVFHDPADTAQKNTYNGIIVYYDHVTSALAWGETEVAFVIDDNDWWISGGSLTLANNVVLKFTPGSILNLEGSGSLVNYNGSGVAFTSFKDDTRKGDTNGDGSATAPANNDWGGIYNDFTSLWQTWGNIVYDSH